MRKALYTTAVALGVAIASYAMMPPSARATTPNTCAVLARGFAPYSPMQINATDQLHQTIQRKIYAACLQTRGKPGASRMTTPRAGTNTTNAGTFVTFDVPGAISTGPNSINNSGAITGGYFDAGGLLHSFLRTSDGTITPFDAPAPHAAPHKIFAAFPTASTRRGLSSEASLPMPTTQRGPASCAPRTAPSPNSILLLPKSLSLSSLTQMAWLRVLF